MSMVICLFSSLYIFVLFDHSCFNRDSNPELMSEINFRIAYLCYAEIMYSDLLKLFTRLVVANQNALFKHIIDTLL